MLVWLNKDTASAIVRELATEQRALTHAGLDELPDSKPVRHLRSVLVATGALPTRDEHLIRLEHWMTATLADRDPEQRALLHATPSGTHCIGYAAATTASTPPTGNASPSSETSGPRSPCSAGSPPAGSTWPAPGKATSSSG